MDNETVKENLKSRSAWRRVLYLLMFVLIFNVAEIVLWALVILQAVFHLVTATPNEKIRTFGAQLALYLGSVAAFLTYASEELPFPFSDWPDGIQRLPGKPRD